jgi:hypothetical protein
MGYIIMQGGERNQIKVSQTAREIQNLIITKNTYIEVEQIYKKRVYKNNQKKRNWYDLIYCPLEYDLVECKRLINLRISLIWIYY